MIETIILESIALSTDAVINVIEPDNGEIRNFMILLHGNMNPEMSEELFHNLSKELELQKLCDRYHMMVAAPFMKNRYYISTEDYDCGKFVSSELPDYMKHRYHLPDSVEMVLAGISMGGYGAALIAAQTGKFSTIISIAGAYIAKDVEIGNTEVWGSLTPYSVDLKKTFLYYFLPLSDLEESVDRNASAAIRLFKERNENPQFVLACGTEDWFYERNLSFLKVLDRFGIDYRFERIDGGGHDPECFRSGLWKAVEYLA